MCEVTGGRSYRIKSHFVLNQCIESLVQKVQAGVVVQFEQLPAKDLKDGEVQDLVFPTTKKMIYVAKHPSQKNQFPVGFWPIPEPYWPDPKALSLPARDAHPKIRIITPCVDEPPMVRNFPFDKYEVEASPLTLQILSKREANKCWPVIIANGPHTLEHPFGYLKTYPPFTQVFLIILPYNYPVLLPLVNELLHKYNSTPPPDWVYKFSVYFRQIPPYYGPFLRRALSSANVPFSFLQYILPENLDSYLSSSVANYLKTMKNTAKQEQDNMCLRVLKQLKLPKPPYHQIETAKLNCGLPLKRDLVSHPQLRETFVKVHNEINVFENYNIVVPTMSQQGPAKNYRNPFEVPRHDLIEETARMRENFFKTPTSNITMVSKDFGNSQPISEMGNYQEYLKGKESPLREIEPTNVRQHMFGNPYKKDKHMVMVDEADLSEVLMKPNGNTLVKKAMEPNNRPRKRKAGPIRKDYIFRRSSTDSMGSISSPCHSPMSMEYSDADSDTSSMRSDDEENDLVIDFEFNEQSSMDDEFNVNGNGHVQSFINGDINEDTDESSTSSPQQLSHISHFQQMHQQPSQLQHPSHTHPPLISQQMPVQSPLMMPSQMLTSPSMMASPNNNFQMAQHMSAPMQMQPQLASYSPIMNTTSNGPSLQNTFVGGMSSMQIPVQQANPSPIPVGSALMPQNDLNDAQEISKILQQCHNGAGSSNTSNSSNNNNTATPYDSVPFANNEQQQQQQPNPKDDPFKTEPSFISTTPFTNSTSNHNNSNDNTSSVSAAETTIITTTTTQTKNKQETGTNDSSAGALNNGDSNNVDNEEQKENIKQHNLTARKIIFQDIRRPGRDYSQLLEHLNLVKGNLETKLEFIQMCISESQRFRRKKMADCIQEWWDKYMDKMNSFGALEFGV